MADRDDVLLEISDFETLNALSRALVEAKFHETPLDAAVPTSPEIAELATRVADRVEAETAKRYPGIHDALAGWRQPGEQPELLEVVRRRLREDQAWSERSAGERRERVRVLLAPLLPVDAVVDELVAYRDRLDARD